ncbi:MAG TPA: DNA primase [Bacteroidales bacterium]|nr:DNA primase [Bacteroidales bacterium]
MIDQSTIDKIYDAAEITDVVQDFVHLKKRGVNYLGLCPFHNEKTPSFTVSPAKGIFKCFGCGKGGNAVNFIMEHEHLGYYESLKYLARKYHIEIVEKELSPEEQQQKNERESLLIVTGFAQKYFTNILLNTEEGLAIGMSYFKERGFRKHIIEKFELGYSPEQRNAFTTEAQKNGYKLDYLVKSGLTIQGERGSFDRFSGRVMFPIHALSGKVIGFGGRILKTDKKTAKYLNSPESDIYHKSRVLYGMYQAKKSVVEHDKCYLVEGYTDVLSFHQNGIENVVASSGTSLTQEQIRLMKRFTNNITVIYDGDEAGVKASLRGIDLILEEGLNVKVVPLPEGEDPDSFSKKKSSTELLGYIEENEKDFITFKTKLLLADAANDPVKKAGLITEIVRSVAVIPDTIIRSVYLKECAGMLQVNEQVLYTEVNKIRRKRVEKKYGYSPAPEYNDDPTTVQPPPKSYDETEEGIYQEKEVVRLLLNFGDHELFREKDEQDEDITVTVAEYLIVELQNDELEILHPLYRKFFDEYLRLYTSGEPATHKYFTSHPDVEISQVSADLLVETYQISKIWAKNDSLVESEEMRLKEVIPETILAFKNKKIMQALNKTRQELKQAQDDQDEERLSGIMQKLMVLNNTKNMLAREQNNRNFI